MKCNRISDSRGHDQGALQVMRKQAVKVIRDGQGVTSVVAVYSVECAQCFRWLAHFVNRGYAGQADFWPSVVGQCARFRLACPGE